MYCAKRETTEIESKVVKEPVRQMSAVRIPETITEMYGTSFLSLFFIMLGKKPSSARATELRGTKKEIVYNKVRNLGDKKSH